MLHLLVSDPKVIEDSQKEKNLMDKNSFLKKDVFDKRLSDNVQSNSRSADHTKRRRAFMSMFTGTANFNMLDSTIESVLKQFVSRIKGDKAERPVIDIRAEII